MTVRPDARPITKEVSVPLDPARAFDLFTTRAAEWWPMATHSVGGATSIVTIDARGAIEILADGTPTSWGEALVWEPPHRIELTWHPGRPAGAEATVVSITFEPTADGRTTVRLVHTGWERREVEMRGRYDHGWDVVLAPFGDLAAA